MYRARIGGVLIRLHDSAVTAAPPVAPHKKLALALKASRAFLGALAALLVLAGQAAAQSGGARGFVWKQCDEDVLHLQLDPAPFEERVGPEFSLRLSEEGRASVIIVVQDCSAQWHDGEEIGPTQDVHMWVMIEGPSDVRPVTGAERTLPTFTWFNLFTGSGNPRARESYIASGTSTAPIEGLSLDPPAPRRGGRVTVGPDLSYFWQVESAPPFARLVGVNHDVYGRDGTGAIVYNRIQALLNVFAWGSEGIVEVVGGMDPERLIGSGTYPVSVHTFRPLWARASLGDASPRGTPR